MRLRNIAPVIALTAVVGDAAVGEKQSGSDNFHDGIAVLNMNRVPALQLPQTLQRYNRQ